MHVRQGLKPIRCWPASPTDRRSYLLMIQYGLRTCTLARILCLLDTRTEARFGSPGSGLSERIPRHRCVGAADLSRREHNISMSRVASERAECQCVGVSPQNSLCWM